MLYGFYFTITIGLLFPLSAHAQIASARSWAESHALASATVAQMTLDEKIGVVTGRGQTASRCTGDTVAVSRLGVPSFCMNDGPAGLRQAGNNVTAFPAGLNVASTFSKRLMRERGAALAREFKGKGINMFLGPGMDIMRNPKMGRAWESFGPDPYLSGEAAFETIMGIQGQGVMACAKHFLGNNQEHWRYGLNADMDDRTMHEIYWWPFLRSIEANVSSIMCAYNRFNQTSSCHNAPLLTKLLREEGGFQGFVVSDWGATHDSPEENANAGLDMEQPGDWIFIGGGVFNGFFGLNGLKAAVQANRVTVARLNQMVSSILAPWFRLGQEHPSYPKPNFNVQRVDGPLNLNVNVRSTSHTQLAREIAARSHVLLKNRGPNGAPALPLPNNGARFRRVSIVGQDARAPRDGCEFNRCNEGVMVVGWGAGSTPLTYVIAPVTSITEKLTSLNSTSSPIRITTSLTNDINAAVAASRGNDVCFAFANAMSGELGTYAVVEGNMGDRNDLELWWGGRELIKAVAAVCNNTIAVIHSVGPVVMPFADHPNVTAVIYAGTAGEQLAPALVDVLWGSVNPSGRLPFSIADTEDAYPGPIVYNSLGFPTITYTEKLLLDYRYMDSRNYRPRFPFGFGLSYTNFTYTGQPTGQPRIVATPVGKLAYTVTFNVTNSGARDGIEIPQLYLGFPEGSGEPRRVLRGFEDVSLAVGETKLVTMSLTTRDISIWNVPAQSWTRPSRNFTVWIGSSIEDTRLTGTF